MPLITDWSGNTLKSSDASTYWSTKGGKFTSSSGITTYFPLPMIYKNSVNVTGTYKVPAHHENRPDLIAKQLYSTEDYWWLVFWINGILDPFSGPKAGDTILVADLNQVKSLLS